LLSLRYLLQLVSLRIKVSFVMLKLMAFMAVVTAIASTPTPAPATWTMTPETACSSRNELGEQTGITIAVAKTWCQGT
jgi:hypothetical protein